MLFSFTDTGSTRELKFKTTPWSTVHPEELGHPQLVKKFPTFYATKMYLPAFTNDHHLSLS